MNETRQRFGDVTTKLQAALALKDVFIQVVSSEKSGRFTKVTAKMSPSDIKWLINNKFTIPKEIGSDSIRVVESDDGVVSIEVGLPFERWKDLSYHDVMFDVFYGSGKTETADMSLPVIFGKMSNGEIVTRDLARLPHLLIGGLTGSGKSVFLNSLICSLVHNHSPEQVRFVLMDPKRVEFGIYAKLPHMYSPIAYEPEQAVTILKHVESEMDRRLALFGEKGCRNIVDFNNANGVARLPYFIVVVDEFSDFIVGSDGAFESTASRIAAIGRSAGVHLVIATSRPDAKIASGSLKANIPGRLAFRVCQKIDSRTLLDEYGAEELLGGGDALLKDSNGELVRLQVPYIRDEAIMRIVESAIVRYPGRQLADGVASPSAEKEDYESMYARALNFVRTTRRASISWLQRKLNIGYKDAAHVLSLLEERGIIGPANDKGPRKILIEGA
jgi:S-DNA-T family DNA segregation ATPase FtsK/SpoIIIE